MLKPTSTAAVARLSHASLACHRRTFQLVPPTLAGRSLADLICGAAPSRPAVLKLMLPAAPLIRFCPLRNCAVASSGRYEGVPVALLPERVKRIFLVSRSTGDLREALMSIGWDPLLISRKQIQEKDFKTDMLIKYIGDDPATMTKWRRSTCVGRRDHTLTVDELPYLMCRGMSEGRPIGSMKYKSLLFAYGYWSVNDPTLSAALAHARVLDTDWYHWTSSKPSDSELVRMRIACHDLAPEVLERERVAMVEAKQAKVRKKEASLVARRARRKLRSPGKAAPETAGGEADDGSLVDLYGLADEFGLDWVRELEQLQAADKPAKYHLAATWDPDSGEVPLDLTNPKWLAQAVAELEGGK